MKIKVFIKNVILCLAPAGWCISYIPMTISAQPEMPLMKMQR